MTHEFSRTQQLIGTEGLEKLRHSSVLVFGIGGVGSHCAEALARAAVGRLILVDSDQVTLTNINRQCIALHSTLGRMKTQVMKERIADICPDTAVETFEQFVLPENLQALMDAIPGPIDCVIDAIDTVSAKLALVRLCAARGLPLIASMGTGNKLHPEQFEIADLPQTSVCPLCRVMRRELKKQGITHLKVLYSREAPIKPLEGGETTAAGRPAAGSISFVPPVAGLMIAGEAVRDLLGGGSPSVPC